MNPVDIIVKKRDGGELTRQELDFFIHGLTAGAIPDYQAAAWLMAIYFRGMTDQETDVYKRQLWWRSIQNTRNRAF